MRKTIWAIVFPANGPGSNQQKAYGARHTRTPGHAGQDQSIIERIEKVQDFATQRFWTYTTARPDPERGRVSSATTACRLVQSLGQMARLFAEAVRLCLPVAMTSAGVRTLRGLGFRTWVQVSANRSRCRRSGVGSSEIPFDVAFWFVRVLRST